MKHHRLFALCLLSTLASAGEPVFDSHVHLRDGEASLQKFEAEVRTAGIDLAGVGAMWFGGPHQALAGDPAKIRAGNDGLIALARIAARGVKTLKIHPHTQRFEISDPRVLALVTKAGELGVAVLMDNAGIVPGDCEDLFNLAAKAPKTRFIFAHMGGANFRFWNILVLARTADGFALDNVNFDISGTVLLAADSPIEKEFVWTLRNVGIDHVMLGSDYPQIPLGKTVDALERLGLTQEEKSAILSGNARRILGAGGKKN